MNGFNPMKLMQLIKGGNPKNIVMNIIQKQMGNNPMINNLMDMAQKGNKNGVETFARNLCKEKGMDFDNEFKSFMNQIKGNNN